MTRYSTTSLHRYPTLLQQIPDNPWMGTILRKKAQDEPLTNYEEFLWNAMKHQPLPRGGISEVLKKYK